MRTVEHHKWIVYPLLNVIFLLFLMCIAEGAASWFYFFREFRNNVTINDNDHTQYDPVLGWINKKNISIPDFYGAGLDLTTDRNGFRIAPPNPNPDALVTLCSGDSFTFGFGVNDVQTWCSLLGQKNFRTINLGEVGYGIDQSYLRYQKEGEVIPHSIHIMAFIANDFDRALDDSYLGYSKPYFLISRGELSIQNIPVPKYMNWRRFFILNSDNWSRLHIYRLLQSAAQKFTIHKQSNTDREAKKEELFSLIIEQMVSLTQKRNALPIVVLLPENHTNDIDPIAYENKYRQLHQLLINRSANAGYLFIDIGEDMFRENPETFQSFFLPIHAHYSPKGHEYVAQTLFTRINTYLLENRDLILQRNSN